MRLGKILSAGMVAWCMGCGTAEYEFPSEQAAEPLQVSQHALTSSWAALPANKNCKFGDPTMDHQSATNMQSSGRKEETLTISGLRGRLITSLQLRRPTGSTATFSYDDVILINYRDSVLMASDKRLAGYLAGISADSITSSAVSYSWPKLKSKAIDNQTAEVAWCTVGNTACSVPPTENTDPTRSLDVNIPNFVAMDMLTYMGVPDSRTFNLVTIGDNDDGTFNNGYQTRDTDCTHGKIDVEILYTSTPVATCTWELRFDALPSLNDAGYTGDPTTDPMGTVLNGQTYTLTHNYSTGGTTTTGYQEADGRVSTYTYNSPNITNNQLSLWGWDLVIKGDEVFGWPYGLVGHIKPLGCT